MDKEDPKKNTIATDQLEDINQLAIKKTYGG
jgi:hypothetical protein